MDVQKQRLNTVLLILSAIILAGCETKSSTDALAIYGIPPSTFYYNSSFEFEFGVSGGEGPYDYRYVQNPDVSDDDGDDTNDVNPFTFQVREGDNSAKPSFYLSGVLFRPDPTQEDVPTRTYTYGVEVLDRTTGVRVTETFEFTVQANTVGYAATDLSGRENRVNNSAVNTLQGGYLEGDAGSACLSEKGKQYEEYVTSDGFRAMPQTFLLRLDAPVVEPVTLTYRFTSAYSDAEKESSLRNLTHARPGVDFIEETKTVTFESGKSGCVIVLDLLDDGRPEEEENLRVEFISREGGFVDFSTASEEITINDNEPEVVYEPEDLTINEGGQATVRVALARTSTTPVTIGFRIDDFNSDFPLEAVSFVPESGVVSFPAGETEATLTINVAALSDASVPPGKLILESDVDALVDRDAPLEIGINRWASTSTAAEIIPVASAEHIVDFDVIDGQPFVLVEGAESGNTTAILRAFDVKGGVFPLSSTSDVIVQAQSGTDVTPVSLLTSGGGVQPELGLRTVLMVDDELVLDGERSGVHYGGRDFALTSYTREEGDTDFVLNRVTQYGSNGDEEVAGALADPGGGLLVYGASDGDTLEGSLATPARAGMRDGFLYRILVTGLVNWARFIGSANDDIVAGVVPNRSSLAVVSESTSTDRDILISQLATNNGTRLEGTTDFAIASVFDDSLGGVANASNFSGIQLAVNSRADLPDSSLTPSTTQDAHLLSFTLDERVSGQLRVRSAGIENATTMLTLADNERSVALGSTSGALEGFSNLGGDDAFLAMVESDRNSNSTTLGTVLQFGTPGNDRVIDAVAVNDRLFYLLWSEDHTDPGGALTYRISPFSVEGEKLSPSLY